MWGGSSQSSLSSQQLVTVPTFFPPFKTLIPYHSSTSLRFAAPLRSHLLSRRHTATIFFSLRTSIGAMAASLQDGGGEEDVVDSRIMKIASAIRVIPDFPKPGIQHAFFFLSIFHQEIFLVF